MSTPTLYETLKIRPKVSGKRLFRAVWLYAQLGPKERAAEIARCEADPEVAGDTAWPAIRAWLKTLDEVSPEARQEYVLKHSPFRGA